MNEDQKKLAHRNIMARAEDYKKTVTKQYLINNIAEMRKKLKEIENE
jgi:hypothetical protein